MFMLGYAWQKGAVPLRAESIEQAIELNRIAVEANKAAFLWGRRAAHDLAAVERAAGPAAAEPAEFATALEDIVKRRIDFLTAYQDDAYARRYKDLVVRVQTREAGAVRDSDALARAVARYYFKLLAYKDEYEVARLYTDTRFLKSVQDRFDGDYKLNFHLAPPLTAERDPDTGHMVKKAYGPRMLTGFRLLAKLKFLRGTAWDPFGRSAERRRERELIAEYEAVIDELLAGLTPANHAVAVEIASIPEHIRGFGHVKERHISDAKSNEAALLTRFRGPDRRHADAAD
jgi:indolepyruvate ferredoxin oxidoreductase